MSVRRVLIAVTSHGGLGSTGLPTGYFLSEVTHSYFELADRGLLVDIVSPRGGDAPMDPKGHDLKDERNRRFLQSAERSVKLETTLRAADVDPNEYDGIFFAGGHGAMWDFPDTTGLQRLARSVYERGGVVAAVCHGPAALINPKLSSGTYLVAGKRMAVFTNEEEKAVNMLDIVPFLLASTLEQRGALLDKGEPWREHVVVDDRLVTGQNPASAAAAGRAMAEVLAKAEVTQAVTASA